MIRLSLLGTVEVEGSGEGGGTLASHTRRLALLAYLALKRPRGFVRRDELLALFWEDLDQVRARKALRQAVYVLRKELFAEVVENRGGDELAAPSEHLWCDAVAFEEALEEGRTEEALTLYRGDLLPGLHLAGASEFSHWLDRERQRLRGQAVEAARRLAESSAASRDLARAAKWATKWLTLAPDDEKAAEHAMRFLALAGDRTGALKLHADFAARLAEEYDLTPSPGLEILARAIHEGDLGPVPPPPGERVPAGPVPQDGASPPYRARRRYPVVAAGTAVAAIAVAGLLWAGQGDGGPQDDVEQASVVAVFPFSVQGDPAFGYLEEGMVDLLSTGLDGAGPFRTLDPATLLAAVQRAATPLDAASAAKLAESLGADLFVLGSVVAVAGSVRVSARMYDGRARVQGVAEGSAEEEEQIFQVVDSVARELLASRYGGLGQRLLGTAARTTRSLPALKAYLAAEHAFRMDRPEEALAEAGRAVALDSSFALAHYRRSTAAAWMSRLQVALESARMAVAFGDQLVPRDRRLLRAHLDQQERNFQAAIDGYRAVLSEQPDHAEAWLKLGEALFHANPIYGRPINEADGPFARALALDPDNVVAALHRARLAASRGDAGVVDSALALVRRVGSDAESELELMALVATLRPEREGAVVDAFTGGRPAVELNSAIWSRVVFAGDVEGAGRLARVALGSVSSPEWQALFHVRLAHLALARGRWEEAWAELTEAESLDPGLGVEEKGLVMVMPFVPPREKELEEVRRKLEAWVPVETPTELAGNAAREGLRGHLRLYLLGLVQARAGDPASARATADALEKLPGSVWPEGLAEGWARGIRAYALHAEGRDEEARLALAEVGGGPWGLGNAPIVTQSAERYLWGMLEAEHGDAESARAAFSSFAYRRIYHVPFIAPAALERARLAAREGRTADAEADYRFFLDSWSECDPVFGALREQAAVEWTEFRAHLR